MLKEYGTSLKALQTLRSTRPSETKGDEDGSRLKFKNRTEERYFVRFCLKEYSFYEYN